MPANCPNCLKSFPSALAVTRHLSQPLTSCLQWINKLQSASQILLQSGQHMTTPSTATTRTPSPVHHNDFPTDFEVEGQDHSNIYYDSITPVNLEDDFPGSIEESCGDQVLEKPYVECFEGAAKDWELGKFLLCSSLSMAAIDQFLGLELADQIIASLLFHGKGATYCLLAFNVIPKMSKLTSLHVPPSTLSGIARPFWCDWPLADPSRFLTPKALHHWHHAFYDHDIQWCLRAVGTEELDFCFSILQPLMTFQHFKDGISNLKQVTGRAQRDLQHYIVALIADAAPPGVVMAVQALMDFRNFMTTSTKSKNVLDNWHIPKLELMQSVVPSIRQVRSLLQWSANTTEHAHITLIKDPADSTNNNNVDAQICRFLNHVEKCRSFQTTTSLIAQLSQSHAQAAGSLVMDNGSGSDDEGANVVEVDAQAAVTDHLWGSKCPVTDFFKKAEQVSSNVKVTRPLRTFVVGSTAIHLNFDPSLQCIPVDVVAEKFSLPDLQGALADYIQREGHSHGTSQSFHKLEEQRCAAPDASLPFSNLMVWFKVRVQQASYYNQSATPPALTINASLPSTTKKYGHYDAAIFAVDDTEGEQWPVTGLKGHAVVEGSLLVTSSHWINFVLLPILSPGSVMLLMSI
ncbi:hypothetical protein BDR05DRAFT_952932 [Suillus weaverae]|nr:hypothetical protein BDR05DRAFT_952932 [Suillus weaverae]